MKKLTVLLLLCVLLLSLGTITAHAEGVEISTFVPDPVVTVNMTGDAAAALNGVSGTIFTVERLSKPVLCFTPADGKIIVKVTVNGKDITDRLVDGTLTLDPVNADMILNVQVETKNSGNASPRTSDNCHLGLWSALTMISLCGLAATIFISKKKNSF